MQNFIYHNPTKVVFGAGTIENISKARATVESVQKELIFVGSPLAALPCNAIFD